MEVQAIEHWHQYSEGRHFIIRTDQQSLKYLLDQKLKTSFQMYWVSKRMGYNYEIQYKKGILTIKATSKQDKLEKGETFLCRELKKSNFLRSLQFDESKIEEEGIKSSYSNGELRVVLPKKKLEEKKDESININID